VINPTNFQDGGASTSKLSNQFRVGGPSGKKWLHELITRLNTIAQADGTIIAGDKTTCTNFLALIADTTFFDKIVKKL
jgi:hypothetical protein